jgi:hypothetical protein
MQIDHPGEDDPWPEVDGGGGLGGSFGRSAGERQVPGRVNDEETVRFVAGTAGFERREEPGSQRKWRSSGQLLGRHDGRC